MNHVAKDAHQLAGKLKALADETRLQMALLLTAHAELCVCDFEHALGISQSKASRHLRYLFHAGLVKDRREGLWMHYQVSPDLNRGQSIIMAALSDAISEEKKLELRTALEHWLTTKTAACDIEEPRVVCCR